MLPGLRKVQGCGTDTPVCRSASDTDRSVCATWSCSRAADQRATTSTLPRLTAKYAAAASGASCGITRGEWVQAARKKARGTRARSRTGNIIMRRSAARRPRSGAELLLLKQRRIHHRIHFNRLRFPAPERLAVPRGGVADRQIQAAERFPFGV